MENNTYITIPKGEFDLLAFKANQYDQLVNDKEILSVFVWTDYGNYKQFQGFNLTDVNKELGEMAKGQQQVLEKTHHFLKELQNSFFISRSKIKSFLVWFNSAKYNP